MTSYRLLSATLLVALATVPLVAQLTPITEERPTSFSLQVGNGVVLNKARPGVSVGLGAAHALNSRWTVRATGEFARAAYDATDWEAVALALTDEGAYTRSYALSVAALRTWPIFGADRHALSAGIGLVGRVYQMRGMTQLIVAAGEAASPGGFFEGTLGFTERDHVSLAPELAYGVALTDRLRVEAFARYEIQPLAVFGKRGEDRLYQTTLLYSLERQEVRGARYGRYAFIDGQRAVTSGLRLSLAL